MQVTKQELHSKIQESTAGKGIFGVYEALESTEFPQDAGSGSE